ncbi:MAG: tetratricopeptide repeat protein [bacterium]|nr:tetratricopeptide repeat protein [bacterium]
MSCNKKIIFCLTVILVFFSEAYSQTNEQTSLTEDPEVIFNKGLKELQNDNINNAINELEKLLSYNTVNPNYYVYLGYLYYVQGSYDDAISVLDKAILINPHIIISHLLLGEMHYQLKNILKSREEFDKVIQLNPNIKLAHIRLYELFKDNNPEKANVHYLKIFQLPPTKLERLLPDVDKIGDIKLPFNKNFIVLKDIRIEEKLNRNLAENIFEENVKSTNEQATNAQKIIVSVKKKGTPFRVNLNFFQNPFKSFDKEKFFIKLVEIVFVGIFLFVYSLVLRKGEREFKKMVLSQYRITTIKKE